MLILSRKLSIYLGIVLGATAIYIGKEQFNIGWFYSKVAVSYSPFYFILVFFIFMYLLLIILLFKLNKIGIYMFIATIVMGIVLSIYSFMTKYADGTIVETFFKAIPGAWAIVCIASLLIWGAITILRKMKVIY